MAKNDGTLFKNDVRPFCWTDLTIRYLVLSSVLYRSHPVQLFLDSIFVIVMQIFIKFFQEVLDGVELCKYNNSDFKRPKKFSITALSRQFPLLDILCIMLLSFSNF